MNNKKRVFLSFASEDLDHVRGLRLSNYNPNLDIDFYDQSIKVPIDSTDAEYIKRKLSDQIRRASVTVCLISEDTHKSVWVDWELRKSDELGNTMIAMAIKGVDAAILPAFIKEKGIKYWSWDLDHLARLINQAN